MTSLVKICCRITASLPAQRFSSRAISSPDGVHRIIPSLYQAKYLSTVDVENGTKTKEEQPSTETAEPASISDEEHLKELNEKLTVQVKEVEDKYVRALAETENVRQRMKKQIDDAKQFGIQQFCKDLLTVADTLRLATDNIPSEQLENDVVKNMHEGLKLTESQLLQVFGKHGVKLCHPEGEHFDPNLHEALFHQPMPEKEPGTVFMVTKPGYTLNDRVLRPALVGVVKGP